MDGSPDQLGGLPRVAGSWVAAAASLAGAVVVLAFLPARHGEPAPVAELVPA